MGRLRRPAAAAASPPLRIVDVGTGSGAIAGRARGRASRRAACSSHVEIAGHRQSRTTRWRWRARTWSPTAWQSAIRLAAGGPPARRTPARFDLVLANLPYIPLRPMSRGLPIAASFEPALGAGRRPRRPRRDPPAAGAAARDRWRPAASPCSRSAATRRTRSARWSSTCCPAGRAAWSGTCRACRGCARGAPGGREAHFRRGARDGRRPSARAERAVKRHGGAFEARSVAAVFPIRMLALDIDGTLVNETRVIPSATRHDRARRARGRVSGSRWSPAGCPPARSGSPPRCGSWTRSWATRAPSVREIRAAGDERPGRLLYHEPISVGGRPGGRPLGARPRADRARQPPRAVHHPARRPPLGRVPGLPGRAGATRSTTCSRCFSTRSRR